MTRKMALAVEKSMRESSGEHVCLPGDRVPNKKPGLIRQTVSLDRSRDEALLRESEILAHQVRLSKLQVCNGCPLQLL